MSEDYRFHQYSGGCQCGAVRFHATELRDNPHICHCRMCQKAVGNLFAALIGVRHEHLTWTRGTPATFQSSEHVARGYCRDCGTPLFYQYKSGEHVSLSIGAFDEPHRIPILYQMGLEGRHPSLLHLDQVEAVGTNEENDGTEVVAAIRASIPTTIRPSGRSRTRVPVL
jgi:hypothetical protein